MRKWCSNRDGVAAGLPARSKVAPLIQEQNEDSGETARRDVGPHIESAVATINSDVLEAQPLLELYLTANRAFLRVLHLPLCPRRAVLSS